jgi:hypothetical protein
MIKARSGNLVIFGLEAKNIERLKAGDPMLFKMSELGKAGPDDVVAILYGETQDEILAAIEKQFGLKMPKIDPVNEKPL